ncbi:hypothetical protein AG1IA_09695 [Rhizoctonia solani AG-1 IA]|uniref:Uncharacterized protein n=1 Tax=Thanatephorus cucumeris (strain AG1-IA) TaxID=983506 RepID=L8WEC9_THACA|nr:hypothetical protein AG1IA_09695 [Rhizoctonia solani AG-1 IA]
MDYGLVGGVEASLCGSAFNVTKLFPRYDYNELLSDGIRGYSHTTHFPTIAPAFSIRLISLGCFRSYNYLRLCSCTAA